MAGWILPPILAMILAMMSWFDDDNLWIFAWVWGVLSFGTYLFMKINDVCPWCKLSFYVKTGRVATGFDYMFRTRCANCGEPADKNI